MHSRKDYMKDLGDAIDRGAEYDKHIDYRKETEKRVKAKAEPWSRPSTISKNEWEHLPHTQEEFDALPAVLVSALGAQYNMKDDDVSGLFMAVMYMSWAYYMLQSREVHMNNIDGVHAAEDKGINRDTLSIMAKIFRENVLRINDDTRLEDEELNFIKDIYGYDIEDRREQE